MTWTIANATTRKTATIPNTFTQRGVLSGLFMQVFYDTLCIYQIRSVSSGHAYPRCVPKLWKSTIDSHRQQVREAILDAAAALVQKHGLPAARMSHIAEETGIGRATLYKYFPDVEAILFAWHERQLMSHLEHLAEVGNRPRTPGARLHAVLEAYALISHEHHDAELSALLHQGEHVARAHQKLSDFIRDLLTEGARSGELRDDVPPAELATFCLHALAGARASPSKAAVHRLVGVTMAGLRQSSAARGGARAAR